MFSNVWLAFSMIVQHKTWFWWFRQGKEGDCELLFERMTISNLQDLLGYMFIICNYIITGSLQKTLQHALRRQTDHPEELMQKCKMKIRVIYYNISSHVVLKKVLKNAVLFLTILKGFEICSGLYSMMSVHAPFSKKRISMGIMYRDLQLYTCNP